MSPAVLVRSPRVEYEASLGLQRALAERRRLGEVPDVIWMLEHPPTFTTGRHGHRRDLHLSDDALAQLGASFHAIDRGGQMTWHGPGQTTGYVIADLRRSRRVRVFVDALVGAMSDAAGIAAATAGSDATGLYVSGRKLGSVGIRVAQGVSTHGLALNRDPDLEWFGLMTACGAPGVPATSIAREGGDPDRERVESALVDALAARLGLRVEHASLDDLVGDAIPA